jgi:hypothetical protein
MGTISAANSKMRHNPHWECIVEDRVPCGSIGELLEHQWGPLIGHQAMASLMVLQIDVEGYEETLLPAVFQEAWERNVSLPPFIHFESKIVKYWDRRDKTDKMKKIHDKLHQMGYYVQEDIEDDLAIFVGRPNLSSFAAEA